MDPLTHTAAGALVGQAFRDRIQGRATLWLAIVAGVVPDIDNFVGLGNPEQFLLQHRGITHSLPGGAAIALFLALTMRLFSKSVSFPIALAVSGGAVTCHIFLDWITSFGTQLLAPFSSHRFAANGIFIIDPLFTAPLGLLTWLSIRSAAKRRSIALIGLALILAYPAANIVVRMATASHVKSSLMSENIQFDRVHVSPEMLTPVLWKIIAEDGEHYRMAGFSLLKPGKALELKDFRKADSALMEQLGARASIFRTWRWFAAYPVMEREQTADGAKVVFSDLRFYSTIGLIGGMGGGQKPFSLTAMLDPDGRLHAYEYGPPRGARLIHRVE